MLEEKMKFENNINDLFYKTKIEFNKLVKEAVELKKTEKIEQNDILKNENYINFLESNINFIENEYKNSLDYSEYNQALNILNANISNFKNRLDYFKV